MLSVNTLYSLPTFRLEAFCQKPRGSKEASVIQKFLFALRSPGQNLGRLLHFFERAYHLQS